MIGSENTQTLKKGANYPVWSSDGNWIALADEASSAGKILVSIIPRIGGAEKKIAEVRLPQYFDRFASWTPDGRWLISIDQESEGQPYHVVLLSVETGEKRRLTAPSERIYGDLGSALSPDGRTLVFTRYTVWGASDLYLLDLDPEYLPAGEPRKLTYGVPNANCPVWTPDGQEIIFCSRVWHYSTMWRIHKDGGGGARPLTFGGRGAYYPDVSRKGSRLLYEKNVWDTNILRVQLQPSGHAAGAAEEFIQSNLVDRSAAWSPDGRWIAFASERSGGLQMWLCNPDGTNLRQLTAMDTTEGMAPVWSPDSQWIVFSGDQEGTRQLYVLNVRGGPPKKCTSDPVAARDPQWSSDGKWIYFWSNRRGKDEVWKVPREGGAEAPAEGIRMGRPDPDRAYVYFAQEEGNQVSIWREPVTGGQPSKVLAGAAWDFAVSKKGLYYALPGPPEAPWNKWVAFYDFATKSTAKIAELRYGTGTGTGFAVSPDGHCLLYTQCDRETTDLMLVENFR
jgi:Tol biopolymer transport system component